MSAHPTRTAHASTAPEQKLPQVKAEALRDQTLATQALSNLDPDATLSVFAAALLAESEDGYTRDAALGILQRARKISPEMLSAAVSKVTSQLAAAMSAFWTGFIQETWQGPEPPPQYVDPNIVTRRKEQEEQEQEQYRKEALDYINQAQAVVSALTIDDSEFPKKEEPAHKTFKLDVGKMIHGLLYKPADRMPEAQKQAPGWLTPPLLDKNQEDITIFDGDIMDIVDRRKLSGEQAWRKLEDRGYNRARIVQAIYSVRKTAEAQIAQSDRILSYIRTDYETHIQPVVQAAVLLGHAVSVVNDFYAPLPPAQA